MLKLSLVQKRTYRTWFTFQINSTDQTRHTNVLKIYYAENQLYKTFRTFVHFLSFCFVRSSGLEFAIETVGMASSLRYNLISLWLNNN